MCIQKVPKTLYEGEHACFQLNYISRGFEKRHYVCRVSANGDHAVANVYRVDIETSTCTCMDYKFNTLPCKHMFAGMHHEQGDMQLPIQYMDSPYCSLDVVSKNKAFLRVKKP